MKEARFWKKKDDAIHCGLCPHKCVIREGAVGLCRARKNLDGTLYTLVYGKNVSMNCDPIEKKPLFHFLPGSMAFSIGTAGCNLFCEHCQNFDISRADPDEVPSQELSPEHVVELALKHGCRSIAYTYNEPTIYHEYAIDCAKHAKEKGLKNIIVTNGFITKEAAEEFAKHMDAANVDLKAFRDGFYRKVCKAKLKPVLDTLKIYHGKLWLEVTNLIIDEKNDDMGEIEEMCRWLGSELSPDVPLHLSRAFPMYKMQDIQPTPEETLRNAKKVAEKHLNYVYIGNAEVEGSSDTICPSCGKVLIKRDRYSSKPELKDSKCGCGQQIAGVFD